MNRTEKAAAVSELQGSVGKATNAFLLDFTGITVPQVTELRRQVRETKSGYVVVKNTLALIAIKDSPMIELRDKFVGPTAVVYNNEDPVSLAKAIKKFSKDVPSVKCKGALLEGKVIPASQMDTIADLPSREQLVSKLLFLLQSPMRNLVTVLNANIRNVAVVLDQVAKQRAE
jgi:large subunit ribosomal protein L10